MPPENKLLTEQTLFAFEVIFSTNSRLSLTELVNYQPNTYIGKSKNSNVLFLAPVGKSRSLRRYTLVTAEELKQDYPH